MYHGVDPSYGPGHYFFGKPNPTGTGIILYGRNGEGRVRNGPAFSVFEDFCQ
jgi:hypothetical protein